MMIEAFNASITCGTMVTIFSYICVTPLAKFYFFICFGVLFVFKSWIRGVAEDEYHIIVDNDYDGDSIDRVQYE